jgi:hypothetical protein
MKTTVEKYVIENISFPENEKNRFLNTHDCCYYGIEKASLFDSSQLQILEMFRENREIIRKVTITAQ